MNLQEETSLWDNLLQRYLCPVSRLCRPASIGLVVIALSRGIESPVPTGVHTLAWTAAGPSRGRTLAWTPSRGLRLVRTPREKNFFVAFGADEPDSSELAKGLKDGVFQM